MKMKDKVRRVNDEDVRRLDLALYQLGQIDLRHYRGDAEFKQKLLDARNNVLSAMDIADEG